MNELDPYSDTKDTCADYIQKTRFTSLSFPSFDYKCRRYYYIIFCLCVFSMQFCCFLFKSNLEIIDMCNTSK